MGIFSSRSNASGEYLGSLPASSDRWKEAFEATLKVNEISSSAIPLPQAVGSMVRVAVDMLNAGSGSIMLLEGKSGRTLAMAASWGLPAEALGIKLSVGESIAGRVLATGKPLLLGQVDGESFYNFVPKMRPIVSSIVVPLRVHGKAMGVLSLTAGGDRKEFTENDLRVAQMFADQAAGLIHRARLHEGAEQRSADLMNLVESSKGLVGTLDLDTLLQRVLDGGSRLLGGADGFTGLFDAESQNMQRGVFRGFDKAQIREVAMHAKVTEAVDKVDVTSFEQPDGSVVVAVGLGSSRGTKGVLALVGPADRADRQDGIAESLRPTVLERD